MTSCRVYAGYSLENNKSMKQYFFRHHILIIEICLVKTLIEIAFYIVNKLLTYAFEIS